MCPEAERAAVPHSASSNQQSKMYHVDCSTDLSAEAITPRGYHVPTG